MPKITTNCLQCGKGFSAYNTPSRPYNTIKYCSTICYRKYLKEHPKPKQECKECHKIKRIRCIGMCHKCYYRLYEKEMRPESSREWRKQYMREYPIKYRSKVNEKRRERQKSRFDFVKAIKMKSSCVDCGISDWRVLDFDHVKGKKVNGVGDLVSQTASESKILAEIAKCEVRCSNCHRIKTIENNQVGSPTANWRL